MRRKPTPSGEDVAAPRRLPQPRKLPTQSRSRALVDAVVGACLHILDSEGAQALTVQRVAEVSGATPGSIYQYFPNMEAIVALVYEQVLREEVNHMTMSEPGFLKLSLRDALRKVVANTTRVELRLFRLNAEFHSKYHRDFHLGFHYGHYKSSQEFIDDAWMEFLRIYQSEVSTPDWQSAAYLLGMGIAGLVRTTLEDDPARLEQPEFQESIVNMAMGVVKPPLG